MRPTTLTASLLGPGLLVFLLTSPVLAEDLWITHVTVVSPERAVNLPDATVKIHDGSIAQVTTGAAHLPAHAHLIEGRGKYLSPGLIDSHVHLGYIAGMRPDQEAKLPAIAQAARAQVPLSFLYFGFTTLVDLASIPTAMQRWNAAPVHPDTFFCGGSNVAGGYPMNYMPEGLRYRLMPYYLARDGAVPAGEDPAAHTPEAVVARMKADGAICVKTFYETGFGAAHDLPVPSLATLRALVAAAHAAGMPVLMHANSSAAQRLALDAGVDVLAHGLWNWDERGQRTLSPAQTMILDRVLAGQRGYQPTIQVLYGERGLFELDALVSAPMRKAVPASLLEWYQSKDGQWFHEAFAKQMDVAPTADPQGIDALAIARVNAAVHYLAEHDAHFLFGSDTPSDETYANPPGLNGVLEMRRLVAAGLSPAQVFKAATLSNARQFGLNDVGSIEGGKRANLLLLRADPTQSLDAYEHIDTVFLAGKPLSRETLAADRSGAGP